MSRRPTGAVSGGVTLAPDPNWFYSTLAQSTAAIVGLAGGFLVQRVLSLRAEIAQDRRDLRSNAQLLLQRTSERKQAARIAANALAYAITELEQKEEAGERSVALSADRVHDLSHGQGYASSEDRLVPSVDPMQALPNLRDAHDAISGLRDALPTTLAELAPMLVRSGGLETHGSPWLAEEPLEAVSERGGIEPANFWDWVPRQRDVARDTWQALNGPPGATDAGSARGLAAGLMVLRERLVPASFWMLWGTLLGMLGAGLIAPLTYLSAREGSASKCVLIAIFGVLSATFLGFIAYELLRIRRVGDLTREAF